MIYKTEDFICPTGSIVLCAIYDPEEMLLTFRQAKGYVYTSDGSTMRFSMLADAFMKEKEKSVASIQEANNYLIELGIDVSIWFPTNNPTNKQTHE